MSGVSTDPIDIQKYKCVPLDLLKNVSPDHKVQFVANTDSVSLKDFKQEQDESQTKLGPVSGKPMDAEAIENFVVGIAIFFLAIFFLILLFYGFLKFRTEGFKAFNLPDIMKGLPFIALSSIIFGILGFVIGYFIVK